MWFQMSPKKIYLKSFRTISIFSAIIFIIGQDDHGPYSMHTDTSNIRRRGDYKLKWNAFPNATIYIHTIKENYLVTYN